MFYLFLRERQRWAGERQRERETKKPNQAPGSEVTRAGLEPMTCEIMTWSGVGCLTDWATQVPLKQQYLMDYLNCKKNYVS